VFVASSVVVFALLRGIAAALMALARRLPRTRFTMLRLAIANIYRPGALTPSVVMSLGLGLAVLVTITQIDGNLRRQFLAALPDRAPSFYFIDIPTHDADRFAAFLKATAPQSSVEDVPMLRGRIVSARGVKADDLKASTDSEWVLQSDRGLTYTGEIPKGSKIVEGEWWGAAYDGPPLVSIEKKIADGLRLKLGDEIVVNVLGRDIKASIGNMRTVDWQSLGIILVLGGALAAGHRHRVYDAVILKTLGATRARLLGAYALEYLMIGFATAIFGVIAGSIAAWLIVMRLMTLSFVWQAGSAAGVVAAALVVTV